MRVRDWIYLFIAGVIAVSIDLVDYRAHEEAQQAAAQWESAVYWSSLAAKQMYFCNAGGTSARADHARDEAEFRRRHLGWTIPETHQMDCADARAIVDSDFDIFKQAADRNHLLPSLTARYLQRLRSMSSGGGSFSDDVRLW